MTRSSSLYSWCLTLITQGGGQESAGVPVRLCMSAGVSSCGMLGRACAPTGEVKWGAHTLLQEP